MPIASVVANDIVVPPYATNHCPVNPPPVIAANTTIGEILTLATNKFLASEGAPAVSGMAGFRTLAVTAAVTLGTYTGGIGLVGFHD